ncbi:MAG: dihydroneopterin triphosphate diphosphatase [Bacteroidota bacterium]
MTAFKEPVSVLVVIHTPALDILLLERAGHPGYWQSVTGSREGDETLAATARREVLEETGLDARRFRLTDWKQSNNYEIFQEWRHRYAPGVVRNTEHVFSLEIPAPQAVSLAPGEHLAYVWLPWQEAARHCFSASNREAILALPRRLHNSGSAVLPRA